MSKEDVQNPIKYTIIKYKEIIFGIDNRIYIKCLDEFKKQQVIDDKTYDQKIKDDPVRKLDWDELHKSIVMDGNIMIDDEILMMKS